MVGCVLSPCADLNNQPTPVWHYDICCSVVPYYTTLREKRNYLPGTYLYKSAQNPMESLRFADESLREVVFSRAELRVIAAIREGASSHLQIADRCGIAPTTAQVHTGHIRRKLGLRRFINLVLWVAVQEADK